MGRRSVVFIEPGKEKKALESELFMARLALVELMPREIEDVLKCGRGISAPYAVGFAVPEGLLRHLIGRKGPASGVFEAARQLAIDHWNREFSPAEQEARITSHSRLEKPRTCEETFLIAPTLHPYSAMRACSLRLRGTTGRCNGLTGD